MPYATIPRGIRNHNPGNIKAVSGLKWRGQQGKDADGFCVFKTYIWGLRAIAVIWQNYCYYHGFTTLRQYIDRWCPYWRTESPDYLNVVAAAAAVDPDEPYNPCDHAVQVMRAIVCMECGYCPYSDAEMQTAIDLAHIR